MNSNFSGVSVTDVSADSANKAKSTVLAQGDLIYMLKPIKVVRSGLMPKSMVSLAVVSRVPSRWYPLFDGDVFLEMFRVLHFGMLRGCLHHTGATFGPE